MSSIYQSLFYTIYNGKTYHQSESLIPSFSRLDIKEEFTNIEEFARKRKGKKKNKKQCTEKCLQRNSKCEDNKLDGFKNMLNKCCKEENVFSVEELEELANAYIEKCTYERFTMNSGLQFGKKQQSANRDSTVSFGSSTTDSKNGMNSGLNFGKQQQSADRDSTVSFGSSTTDSTPDSQNEFPCDEQCFINNVKCPLTLENYIETIKGCCSLETEFSIGEINGSISAYKLYPCDS